MKYIGDWINKEGICHFTKKECREIKEDYFKRKCLFRNKAYCSDCEEYKKVRESISNSLYNLRRSPFGLGLPPKVI